MDNLVFRMMNIWIAVWHLEKLLILLITLFYSKNCTFMELDALLINGYQTICPIENNLWNTIMLNHPCYESSVVFHKVLALAPPWFLIYINDLAFVSSKLFAVLFADHSNFFCAGKNIHDLINIVNNELVNIVDWLNANKMSLNIEKTHYIIFCNRGKIIGEVGDVLIIDCKISNVYNTKFLGMIINSILTWKCHIDYICNKFLRVLG